MSALHDYNYEHDTSLYDAWDRALDHLQEQDPLAFVEEVISKDEKAAEALTRFLSTPTVTNADDLVDQINHARERVINKKQDFPPLYWS